MESDDDWMMHLGDISDDEWREDVDFNEDGWQRARAPIGYGSSSINTEVRAFGPVLFRRVVSVPRAIEEWAEEWRMGVRCIEECDVYVDERRILEVDDDDDGLVVALGFGSVPTGADDDDEGN